MMNIRSSPLHYSFRKPNTKWFYLNYFSHIISTFFFVIFLLLYFNERRQKIQWRENVLSDVLSTLLKNSHVFSSENLNAKEIQSVVADIIHSVCESQNDIDRDGVMRSHSVDVLDPLHRGGVFRDARIDYVRQLNSSLTQESASDPSLGNPTFQDFDPIHLSSKSVFAPRNGDKATFPKDYVHSSFLPLTITSLPSSSSASFPLSIRSRPLRSASDLLCPAASIGILSAVFRDGSDEANGVKLDPKEARRPDSGADEAKGITTTMMNRKVEDEGEGNKEDEPKLPTSVYQMRDLDPRNPESGSKSEDATPLKSADPERLDSMDRETKTFEGIQVEDVRIVIGIFSSPPSSHNPPSRYNYNLRRLAIRRSWLRFLRSESDPIFHAPNLPPRPLGAGLTMSYYAPPPPVVPVGGTAKAGVGRLLKDDGSDAVSSISRRKLRGGRGIGGVVGEGEGKKGEDDGEGGKINGKVENIEIEKNDDGESEKGHGDIKTDLAAKWIENHSSFKTTSNSTIYDGNSISSIRNSHVSTHPLLKSDSPSNTNYQSIDGEESVNNSRFSYANLNNQPKDHTVSLPQWWRIHGVVARFVMGHSKDPLREELMDSESREFGDVIRLDMEDTYHNLNRKTLKWLEAVAVMFPSASYYVKADDDVFLIPQRLVLAVRQWEHLGADYIGCFKKGKIFTDKKHKWYEPHSMLLGREYHLHASGSCYVVSGNITRRFIARNQASLRLLNNEDTMMGLWMVASNAVFFQDKRMCAAGCGESSVAVTMVKKLSYTCNGLCDPIYEPGQLLTQPNCTSPDLERRLVLNPKLPSIQEVQRMTAAAAAATNDEKKEEEKQENDGEKESEEGGGANETVAASVVSKNVERDEGMGMISNGGKKGVGWEGNKGNHEKEEMKPSLLTSFLEPDHRSSTVVDDWGWLDLKIVN